MSRTLEPPPVEEGREAWQEAGTSRPEAPRSGDYVPFGNVFVHETRMAQCLAHPLRSFGRKLPWGGVPSLLPDRSAVLWSVRRKCDERCD